MLRRRLLLAALALSPCGALSAQTAAPPAAAVAARPADVATPEAIIRAMYESISGGKGVERDWARFRTLFVDGARMIPTGFKPDGSYGPLVWTLEEYIKEAGPGLMKDGFFEKELFRRGDEFGHIAQYFSTYDSRITEADPKPFQRGINSIQLLNDGKRWWIVTVFWARERPTIPIPAKYLPPTE